MQCRRGRVKSKTANRPNPPDAADYRFIVQAHRSRLQPGPGSVPAREVEVHLQRVVSGVLHFRPRDSSHGASSMSAAADAVFVVVVAVAVAVAAIDVVVAVGAVSLTW